jgi:putative membrane protein
MKLSQQDHALVTAAVSAGEATTDAEIITIVADRSDAYHDVGLHWAVLAMLLALALVAFRPDFFAAKLALFSGGWGHEYWSARALLTALLVLLTVKFLAVRYILAWMPLRMALTPRATKARRVRRRAVAYFKVGAEKRTASRSGVLLYLSLAEHRAEIIADSAVHAKVPPELWGEAMAALVDAVRAGRPGEGMAAAVTAISVVLAEHFPRTGADPNELPDRLIEL